MSNEPELIEVESFERVDVATGAALLRVAVRLSPELDLSRPPILVIDTGEERHELEPLPSPPGQPGVLRAAYSVRVAVLDAGPMGFALELSDGLAVELPAPTIRERPGGVVASPPAARPTPADASELHEERQLRVAAERRAESRRHAITELERRVLEEEELRQEAEQTLEAAASETAQARNRADVLEDAMAQAQARIDDFDGQLDAFRSTLQSADERSAELERLTAEQETELEVRRQRVADLAEERDAALAAASAAADDLEALGERASQIAQQVQAHQTSLSSADERSAELERIAAEQERRIDDLTGELADARQQAGAHADEIADARDREQSLQAMLDQVRQDLLLAEEAGDEGAEALASISQARELVASVEAQALELAERVAALAATLAPAEELSPERGLDDMQPDDAPATADA